MMRPLAPIPRDKLEHGYLGLTAYIIGKALLGPFLMPEGFHFAAGLMSAFAVGVLKELGDRYVWGGDFDVKDIHATLMGGIFGALADVDFH